MKKVFKNYSLATDIDLNKFFNNMYLAIYSFKYNSNSKLPNLTVRQIIG